MPERVDHAAAHDPGAALDPDRDERRREAPLHAHACQRDERLAAVPGRGEDSAEHTEVVARRLQELEAGDDVHALPERERQSGVGSSALGRVHRHSEHVEAREGSDLGSPHEVRNGDVPTLILGEAQVRRSESGSLGARRPGVEGDRPVDDGAAREPGDGDRVVPRTEPAPGVGAAGAGDEPGRRGERERHSRRERGRSRSPDDDAVDAVGRGRRSRRGRRNPGRDQDRQDAQPPHGATS